MATLLRSRPPAVNGARPPAPPRPAGRRVQVPWLVLGLLLVAGSALGFATWAGGLDERVEVLVAARPLDAGATLGPGDLATASVGADASVALLGAEEADRVVGRRLVAPVAQGTLLQEGLLASGAAVAEGTAVVGLALAPGAVPTSTLGVGDRVAVVAGPGPEGRGGAEELATAEVFAVEDTGDGVGTRVVSLALPAADAPAVAGAADRVRLLLLGGEAGR